MDEVAGLNDVSTYDIIMGIVYGVSAIVLGISAFVIYTKQFRRKNAGYKERFIYCRRMSLWCQT